MAFTVVTWNVEFFGSARADEDRQSVTERIARVFDLLASSEVRADVNAIFKVNGAQVFDRVRAVFPDYT